MRVAAVLLGVAAGGANYALLARGCKKLIGPAMQKRGALWLLAGFLVPAAGMIGCGLRFPALLPWFGCAVGGALVLLAIAQIIFTNSSK
ncbi:MAG: hypothetical protein LBB50_06715 [Oscillospiraceae bacterium]|jgi:hypothetical protein|nr:hypothetical protein [Oscillospiraceae bacterium]